MLKFRNYITNLFRSGDNADLSTGRKMGWQEKKERLLSMPLDEKRHLYTVKEYKSLKDISNWIEYSERTPIGKPIPRLTTHVINDTLNAKLAEKVSIFRGDITTLEIDVIVNAANKYLLEGGGVSKAIHQGAGKNLLAECRTLKGCETGRAKITGGYNLPARYVIHAVGPVGEKPALLAQCYRSCLELIKSKKLRTIAFPCISAGIFGYPLEAAAHIAAYEVRKHLEKNPDAVDRVIFCLFLFEDEPKYHGIMQSYFPLPSK